MRIRIIIVISLFVTFCHWGFGQVQKMNEYERKVQQAFIRQDTLPVQVTALSERINTPFSEYAGRLHSDSTFIFTSMRSDAEEDFDHYFETSWYCKIYSSVLLPDGEFAPSEPLPSIINHRNTFNSNFCYDERDRMLIYSRCQRDNNSELKCELWQSEKRHNQWERPRKLPQRINAEGYSTLQPHLVHLPEYDVLYFVSNRPNGYGGMDIWYAIRKDGNYDMPINAGNVINTEGNEITPFYDTAHQILYFSSDEHLGIGDYDIFYSQGALSQWGEVSNMGVPFNSAYNDYYLVINEDGKSGYFSSNRPNDTTMRDTCCNDLFAFEWKTVQDSVTVEKKTDTVELPTIVERIANIAPITLYFENDAPDPRSTSDSTHSCYSDLYHSYLAHIQQYLKNENGQTLEEKQALTQFIQDSVATGYERMKLFVSDLKQALLQGYRIELSISGYASPLHNSAYNKHLSNRRIVSLINQIQKEEQGFFTPYITKKKEGLTISTNPEGAINHSFRTSRKEETVYGIQAARDRKIEVRASILPQ